MAIGPSVGDAYVDLHMRMDKKELTEAEKAFQNFANKRYIEQKRLYDRLTGLGEMERSRNPLYNMEHAFRKGMIKANIFHSQENGFYKIERALSNVGAALEPVRHQTERVTDGFQRLQKIGIVVQTALGTLAGSIGDLVGGVLSLVGVLGVAGSSLVAVGGAFFGLMAGMAAAKIAMSGVGNAISQLWSGQNNYNQALRDSIKNFRDLKFGAEDAAISEKEAAIELEKAREALARVQNLPPDNRLRRETELQYERADLNYRRALARTKDVNDEIARGPKKVGGNPYANLTKSQIKFVKYFLTLKPAFQELKEAAASGFLPMLQKALNNIMKGPAFGVIKRMLHGLGEAMGDASITFSNAFKDPANLKLLIKFAEGAHHTIEVLGHTFKRTFGGLLAMLEAASPITRRFTLWIDNMSIKFENWAKTGLKSGKLTAFYKLAGDVMGRLGTTFGNVIKGIQNIMHAIFPSGAKSGAGGMLLDFFEKITKNFSNWTGGKEFSKWIEGTTSNTISMLSTIGKFLKIFTDLAASPETKKFWDILATGAPYLRSILADGQAVGPMFADLIVKLLKFLDIFSDTKMLTSFFNTLNTVMDALIAIFNSPGVQMILNFLAGIHGAVLAAALVFLVFRKALQVMIGYMMKLSRTIGAVSAASTKMGAAFSKNKQLMNMTMVSEKSFNAALDSTKVLLKGVALDMNNKARAEYNFIMSMGKAAGYSKKELKALQTQIIQNAATAQAAGKKITYNALAQGTGFGTKGIMGKGGKAAGAIGAVAMGATALGDVATGNGSGWDAVMGLGATGMMFGPWGMAIGGVVSAVGAVGKTVENIQKDISEKNKEVSMRVKQMIVEDMQTQVALTGAIAGSTGATGATAQNIATNLESRAGGIFAAGGVISDKITSQNDIVSKIYTPLMQGSELFGDMFTSSNAQVTAAADSLTTAILDLAAGTDNTVDSITSSVKNLGMSKTAQDLRTQLESTFGVVDKTLQDKIIKMAVWDKKTGQMTPESIAAIVGYVNKDVFGASGKFAALKKDTSAEGSGTAGKQSTSETILRTGLAPLLGKKGANLSSPLAVNALDATGRAAAQVAAQSAINSAGITLVIDPNGFGINRKIKDNKTGKLTDVKDYKDLSGNQIYSDAKFDTVYNALGTSKGAQIVDDDGSIIPAFGSSSYRTSTKNYLGNFNVGTYNKKLSSGESLDRLWVNNMISKIPTIKKTDILTIKPDYASGQREVAMSTGIASTAGILSSLQKEGFKIKDFDPKPDVTNNVIVGDINKITDPTLKATLNAILQANGVSG